MPKRRPLSINAFFNAKTLDYRVDNQAFVIFIPPQYETFFIDNYQFYQLQFAHIFAASIQKCLMLNKLKSVIQKTMFHNSSTIKIIGYILFTISCLIWVALFILPFFIKDISKIIAVNTLLLIISEGSFVLSILILGKSFWQKIKSFFTKYFHKLFKK
jgi:hypothetical protein